MECFRIESLLLATNIFTEMYILKVEEVWWHIISFCGSIKTFKATKVLKTIKAVLNQSKLGGRDVIVMGVESPKLA